MINYHTLSALAANAVLSILAIGASIAATYFYRRAWRNGRGGQCAMPATATGLLLMVYFMLRTGALVPAGAPEQWQFDRIVDVPDALFATTVLVIQVASPVVLAWALLYLFPLGKGALVWLGQSGEDQWAGVNNLHRLHRSWCLGRGEKLLGEQLVAHAGAYSAEGSITLRRNITAEAISTSVHTDPPLQQIEPLVDVVASGRWVQTVDVDTEEDTPVLRVQWNVAAMDAAASACLAAVTGPSPDDGTSVIRFGTRRRSSALPVAALAVTVVCAVSIVVAGMPSVANQHADSGSLGGAGLGGGRLAGPGPVAPRPGGLPQQPPGFLVDPPSHSVQPDPDPIDSGGYYPDSVDHLLRPAGISGDACALTGPDADLPARSRPAAADPCNAAGAAGDSYSLEFENRKVVSAVEVFPAGLDVLRVPTRVIWRFDNDPSTDVEVAVGPTSAWNHFALPAPRAAARVTVFVAQAVPARRASGFHDGGGVQVIGHDLPDATSTAFH